MKKMIWIFLALGLIACQATVPTPAADFPPPATVSPLVDIPAADTLSPAVPLPASPAVSAATGAQVVYVKDGNLWLWADGSIRQLTDSAGDSFPRLSDDGRLVFFLRGSHLWAVDVDGANVRQLDALDKSTGILSYYPLSGSHRLFFTTRRQAGAGAEPNYDLYLADADTLSAGILLQPGDGGLLTFSPDGNWLLLSQPEKINVARVDGSGLKTVLLFPRVTLADGQVFVPPVAWLSNSYGFKTVIPSAQGSGPARYLFVAAEGGEPAQMALINAAPVKGEDLYYLSPDSDRVAYLRESGGKREIHVIDASTADSSVYAAGTDQLGLLGWGADGRSLVFWLDQPSNRLLLGADGSVAPLSDTALVSQFAWIGPAQILFLSGSELRLRATGQASIVLDAGNISEFSGRLGR